MTFTVQSLATATPEYRFDQTAAAKIAQSLCCETDKQRRALAALYRQAGVGHRHCVMLEPAAKKALVGTFDGTAAAAPPADQVTQNFFDPARDADDCGPTTAQRMQLFERHAPALATKAVRKAIAECPWDASELTHLVTVSCTGFSAPGVDLAIIRDCGLSPEVMRTNVGFMGCHGAINGLRTAAAFAAADSNAKVLLCCVELCSVHQQYGWHRDRIVSNALFADGAAAIIGSASPQTHGSFPTLTATGSRIIADTEEFMSWHVRDHGFEMSLSSQVPDMVREQLRPWLTSWLSRHDLTIADIGSWAVHPGGPRILQACSESLALKSDALDASHHILKTYGNMSSPTVLFILERLLQTEQPSPCVMLAFGPGLSIEAALFE